MGLIVQLIIIQDRHLHRWRGLDLREGEARGVQNEAGSVFVLLQTGIRQEEAQAKVPE